MKHPFACVGLILGLVLLIACGAARGQAPATAPATAPAGDTPTTAPGASPKAALKAYNAAMRAGDLDGIVALQHATDETEQRVARALARSEVHVGRLLQAARERFGPDGAARIAKAMHDVSDAEIDAATQTIQGDRALVRFPDSGAAAMIRVDGEWKASVAEVIRSYGGHADQTIDQVTRRGNFAKVLAQDIAAGQVKTVEDTVARIERHERGMAEEPPAN